MNLEQQIDVLMKIDQLKGSRANVYLHASSVNTPYISVHRTASGNSIASGKKCNKVQSCCRFYQYEMAIIVLNKIIQQAKNN